MMKTILKRSLCTMLVLALVAVSFFVFDPSAVFTAQAAVTAAEPTYGDLYFVAPEAIYLAPVYNSYTATTSSAFQWYVNNTLTGTTVITDSGESSTGRIAFRYANAASVQIRFKWQSEPGQDLSSSSTITFGDGTQRTSSSSFTLGLADGYGAAMITGGNSPSLTASTTGAWICWIANYTDTADGMQKEAYAYTYVYKPYVEPIAVGIRAKNTRGTNFYGSYMSWISGVHGVSSVRSEPSYPNTSDKPFLPFASSASGVASGSLNFTLGSFFAFPDGNSNPAAWTSSSQTAVPDPTVYTFSSTDESHSSGDDYVITYAYSSTGKLTVDKSRYTNLNQIPNLSVGLMVTDDEDSSTGGAWFVSNFDAHTFDFDTDYTDYWHTDIDTARAKYWDALCGGDKIAGDGSWDNQTASETVGVKINERWRRDISDKSSGILYVGTGYANHQKSSGVLGFGSGTDYIYDTAELRCYVEMFDKTALRNAYFYAMNSFPVNNPVLLGSNSASWTQFIVLYRAVAKWLTKVDCGAFTTTEGYNSAAALANALKGKTDQIKSMGNEDRANYIATQYNIRVYDDNGTWRFASRSVNQTDQYPKGACITYTADAPAGYRFVGSVGNYKETQTTVGGVTVKQASDMQNDEETLTLEGVTGPVQYSYYYLRDEYTIAYDLGGGTIAAGNPTSYNIDSGDITLNNPTRSGYAFIGWTGSNGDEAQMTVTIPAGSTGSKSYTANWEKQGSSDAAAFFLSEASANPGKQVSVTVSVRNNPGIVAAMLRITYDPQVLTLIDVTSSDLLGTDSFHAGYDITKIPYTIYWVNSLLRQNITEDGVLATLTFRVADDAPEGATPISLTYAEDSTLNVDLQQVAFETVDGAVNVITRLPGDVNGDGVVNLKDVIILIRYLAGWQVTIDENNADVDGSGTINLVDVILIERWLAGGWDVVLL